MNNPAFHATLEVKQVTSINADTQDLVKLELTCHEHLKLRSKKTDGIEVYMEIELIGRREDLDKYHLDLGKHAGLVLRVID